MSTQMIVSWVEQMYPTKEWRTKVNNMPIEQVVAIYYSAIERQRKKKEQERIERMNERYFHQITLDEYFKEGRNEH